MKAKKLILLGIALAFWHFAIAQVSITRAHMPKADDQFNYDDLAPNALQSQFSQRGENQVWRFNTTNPNKSVVEYQASARTPYAFYFFNTVGRKIADSIGFGQFQLQQLYQFYGSTNQQYTVDGLGFRISLAPIPLAGVYSDKDEIYQFPLSYGNRPADLSTFKVNISIPTLGSYQQEGTRKTEVLGWGKAIMANGQEFECLQVLSEIESNDSILIQGTGFGFTNNRFEMRWLSPKHRAPLAEINGNIIGSNLVPTQARVLDNPIPMPGVGLVDPDHTTLIKIYPNPFTDWLVVAEEDSEISLLDFTGKLCYKGKTKGVHELRHLNSGTYFYQLTSTQGVSQSGVLIKAEAMK